MTKLIAYLTDLVGSLAPSSGEQTQLLPVRVERDVAKRDLLNRR